jgi:mannose/cellobiose epimerase-like protein (N-acyl-D-glucosamine 2-epimerase family)
MVAQSRRHPELQNLTPADSQFVRFVDAADQLGENLNDIFNDFFAKLACSNWEPASSTKQQTPLAVGGASEKITRLAERNTRVPLDFPSLSDAANKLPSSLIVRLHLVEAMMVLLFKALDEKQQNSVKQGFDRLLDTIDTSQIPGVRKDIMGAYRDALTAMHSMLSSNPTPGEMAAALSGDFAKKF